jgi:hypothetical protein
LHYDCWHRERPLPDVDLFIDLLELIEEYDQPFAVGSRWDHSKNALVILCHYLRQHKETGLNIPKIILQFRMQYHKFLVHDSALGDAFRLFIRFTNGI